MEMPQPQHGGGGGVELGSGSGGAPLSPPLSPASAAAAALANARWNPTKEQVAVLEGLYEHGVRTPSAEQIKQITARLREHGQIEGKNVFYWFQNHKARQRQKQKQDSFAYFTRFLRRPPPLPMLAVRPPAPPPLYPHPAPPAAAAAACSSSSSNNNNAGTHVNVNPVMYRAPYYMPAPQAPGANTLYYHHPQQQMPLMYPRMEVAQDKMIPAAAQHQHQHQHQRRRHYHPAGGAMYQAAGAPNNASAAATQHALHFPAAAAADAGPSRETLQLFPLQPSYLLPDKARAAAAGGGAAMAAASTASALLSAEESGESMGSQDADGEAPSVPFYDFFGLQSGGR
ncbi:unnamed protein product [Urochloa humidicola]